MQRENSSNDMSLMYIVEQIEKSLNFEFEVNWTRIGGVIDIPGWFR